MSQPSNAADVIRFPIQTASDQASSLLAGTRSLLKGANTALLGQLGEWSTNAVDDWGRDNDFAGRVWAMCQLRWQISVGGYRHLPRRDGALITINARRFALAPVFSALAIGAKINRPVRFVGRSDIPPFGPMMQRLGGLLPRVDEIEGALRAGELIVMGTSHQASNRDAGTVDHRLVGAAVAAGVDVFPAASASSPTRRGARVDIGAPVRSKRRRRGPLRELELADQLEQRINALLNEFGGVMTGTPLDWLPISGIGGL